MDTTLSEKDSLAVKEIIMEQLGASLDQITWEADLEHDLGADSLDVMEITLAIEEHFDLSIPDEQLENVKTVGGIFELLQRFVKVSG